MPPLLYGTGAYKREYGNLPELKCVNLYTEASPTSESGVVLQSRRGLTSHATRGTGPINGIFSEAGVFSGAIFSIATNTLYKDATSLGTVSGSGATSWAASDTEVVVTRGGSAYSYNGTNLAAIAFPDGADVSAVAYIASKFVFVRKDTHKFYWSQELDARDVESLDFASAELAADKLLDVKSLHGNLYLFGQNTTEVWMPTSNADLPFSRIDQRLAQIGVRATGCAVVLNEALWVVGSDNKVYRIAGGWEPVSNAGIEERLSQSTTCVAFGWFYEGQYHFAIRLDDSTFAFNGEWWELTTYDRDNWQAKCATNVGTTPYFGDDTSNNIWKFGTTFKDASAQLEAYFTALKPITGGGESFDNVEVRANVGQTQALSGDDASPVIEMRSSRDAGITFGNWKEASLGAQGAYRTKAQWRRCGMFDSPGAYLEFRMSDQSPRRISGVYYNEPGGGRSR